MGSSGGPGFDRGVLPVHDLRGAHHQREAQHARIRRAFPRRRLRLGGVLAVANQVARFACAYRPGALAGHLRHVEVEKGEEEFRE